MLKKWNDWFIPLICGVSLAVACFALIRGEMLAFWICLAAATLQVVAYTSDTWLRWVIRCMGGEVKFLVILALLLIPAASYADQYDAQRAALRAQIAALQSELDRLNTLADALTPTPYPPSPFPRAVWNTDGSVYLDGKLYAPVMPSGSVLIDAGACGSASVVSVQAVDASGRGTGPIRRVLRFLRHPFKGRGGASACGG